MYIVSACLAGINSRYDGRSTDNEIILDLVKRGEAIPVCPEMLGGLPVPRIPCEIVTDENGEKRIISRAGRDLTEEFMKGAMKTLEIAKIIGAKKAILKAKSPSCGCGRVYDGTFSGRLIEGNGFAAELLIKNGIEVCTENDIGL